MFNLNELHPGDSVYPDWINRRELRPVERLLYCELDLFVGYEVTLSELATRLSINAQTAHRVVSKLEELGLIRIQHTGRGSRYHIVEDHPWKKTSPELEAARKRARELATADRVVQE